MPVATPFRVLSDLIFKASEREALAVIAIAADGQREWSYGQLADAARRLAAGLRKADVGREEPIAILAPNRPEWVAAYFGIIAAGATAAPLDNGAAAQDVARMIRLSGCRRIFTTDVNRRRLRELPEGADLTFHLLDLEPGRAAPDDWRTLMADADSLPDLSPEQRASLLFTSGTTGEPKAVPLTHRNLVSNLQGLLTEPLVHRGERVVIPLPLHHTYPFTVGLLGALASGAAAVFPAGVSGPQLLDAVRATKPAALIGVPGLYAAILRGIETRMRQGGGAKAAAARRLFDLSLLLRRRLGLRAGRLFFRALHRQFGGRLRILGCGGAKLDPEIALKLEALGWMVLSGYGLTETSPILTFNPRGRRRLDSEGLPIHGIELRIEPSPGEAYGPILVRGASVFAGYLDRPEANAMAFASGGWFRTGDLGFLGPAGHLHVVGRANETLVLPGGKKLFPEDAEAAYGALACVKELAVLLEDGRLVALIVPDPDAIRDRGAARLETLLRDELEQHAAGLPAPERISGYAIAREPLPRTHLGKLRRHLLPAIYRAAKAGRRESPPAAAQADPLLADPAVREIWEWLRGQFPERAIGLDTSPQLDLGIDSIKWIELSLALEDRFGVRLTEQSLARVIVLRDLLEEIVGARAARGAAAPAAEPMQAERRAVEPPGAIVRGMGWALLLLNCAIMRTVFRLSVRGAANIPRDGRLLLTPNHASYLDPLAVAAALPWPVLRRTCWAGWTGILHRNRLMRAFSRATRILPVDPDRDPRGALALGAAALDREDALVWFPEGRRSPSGEIGPFMPGVGVLLQRTGAPALPVRIAGSFEAWPRGRRWPRPRRLTITFGTPIAADELRRRGTGASDAERIADGLRAAVTALPAD
jgi:long-chain acyl-CoA synthetase